MCYYFALSGKSSGGKGVVFAWVITVKLDRSGFVWCIVNWGILSSVSEADLISVLSQHHRGKTDSFAFPEKVLADEGKAFDTFGGKTLNGFGIHSLTLL